jgi:hypothetical protein
MMVSNRLTWLFILGLFWLGSILANKWTLSQSKNVQYLGLLFYIVLEAVIFLPLIYIVQYMQTELKQLNKLG